MCSKKYAPVIGVDDAKCKNCHACIEACPVKFCIDGSGETVKINHERCIGCGRCIDACHHEARFPLDDSEAFFRALASGERCVAIVAPAAASSFAGKTDRLIGWLRSIGVSAVFDASFGAELTAASYVGHIKRSGAATVIAQPCPAIVSYIELYRPELLPHLAPVDSPLMHGAKMIRARYPEFAKAKIAAITPCLAKKREFEDTGIIAYNVMFKSISARLKAEGRTLASFSGAAFDGPDAERGAGFPLSGGLMRTLQRDAPEIAAKTRTIEGPTNVYPYLDTLKASIASSIAPLVVDCLNCDHGCIVGPGCDHKTLPLDLLKNFIDSRIAASGATGIATNFALKSPFGSGTRRRLAQSVARASVGVDFGRAYVNRSATGALSQPTEGQIAAIYAKMGKKTEADIYDCASCGYGSCKAMAIAIHNGLNKGENCHHYQQLLVRQDRDRAKALSASLREMLVDAEREMTEVNGTMNSLTERCSEQAATIEESTQAIESMISSIREAATVSTTRRAELERIVEGAGDGEKRLSEASALMDDVRASVSGIGEMSTGISEMASRINLLSMNAAIEAAHAGAAGKGFAVISGEVKRLADASSDNSAKIEKNLTRIETEIAESARFSLAANESVKRVMRDVGAASSGVSEVLNLLESTASGSAQIQEAMREMRELTVALSESYAEIAGDLDSLAGNISRIRTTSDASLAAVGGE